MLTLWRMNVPLYTWTWRHSVVLLCALLLPLIGMAPASHAIPRAQPALLRLAADRPNEIVQVIVQTLAPETDIETTVVELGGRVTKQLGMIHAVVAELPAKAILALARNTAVRWISLDAAIQPSECGGCVDASKLRSAYIRTIGADRLWSEGANRKQQDFAVAVVDSGITSGQDLSKNGNDGKTRVVAQYSGAQLSVDDGNGHGSHVAGIIAGNGVTGNGAYIGVAPRVNLVNVKVSNAKGMATTADVIAGLQWVHENQQRYNIRVLNLSLNSSVAESYHTSPLNAALEVLWFNGITVVVSAGNTGTAGLYPPANDPFVITVGAVDDQGTPGPADDTVAAYSAYGTTLDGHAKPELVAPATNIVSLLAGSDAMLAREHPSHVEPVRGYFRMSGTSMAAPVVAGTVALLLESDPNLTPDQIKARLMATARPMIAPSAGAGEVDAYAAVHGRTSASANGGLTLSQLLWNGSEPVTYGSANWGSANWGSANWGSVNWSSVYWGP